MNEQEWQTEEDLHALQRAEQVKSDQARLKKAQDLAAKKAQDLNKIQGKTATPPPAELPPKKNTNSKFNLGGVS